MPSLENVLYYLGQFLALVFLLRFARYRFARVYPFFAAYVLFMAARLAFVFLIADKLTIPFYNNLYWATSNLHWVVATSAVWEVLRQLAPGRHPLRGLFAWASLLLLAGLAISFAWIGPEGKFFADMERKLTLMIGGWLLLVCALGLSYGLPLAKPVWGIAWGLGISASMSLMNFAALGLSPEFRTAWGFIRQFGFSVVMLIWLWAFWRPLAPKGPEPPISSTVLLTWQDNWERLKTAIKAFVHS